MEQQMLHTFGVPMTSSLSHRTRVRHPLRGPPPECLSVRAISPRVPGRGPTPIDPSAPILSRCLGTLFQPLRGWAMRLTTP